MKKIILILGLLALVLGASACQSSTQKAQQKIVGQVVNSINRQLAVLRKNEALPTFKDSAALHVQDAYYTADADPNKLWYVTLVALDGTPYAHFTTRGAPQPAGDQVTNPVQIACPKVNGNGRHCDVIGLPEPNGVHQGTGNEGYVAILTTGAMVRIPANAVISDQPFSIKTPIKLSIDETQQISHTDTTKTTGAIVPSGTGKRK
jgi:hypothetical protein